MCSSGTEGNERSLQDGHRNKGELGGEDVNGESEAAREHRSIREADDRGCKRVTEDGADEPDDEEHREGKAYMTS